jgi:hypothetical protein
MLDNHNLEQPVLAWDGFPEREIGLDLLDISHAVRQILV